MWLDSSLSRKELKKLYRQLCKTYHPDNLETGDEQKFLQIQNEYELLSNRPTTKFYKVILKPSHIIQGVTLDIDGNKIVIPKNYNKLHTLITRKHCVIDICVRNTKDEEIILGKHPRLKKIIYVTLDELKENKTFTIDVMNKQLKFTIPFDNGKMYKNIKGIDIELRIRSGSDEYNS